MHPFTWSRILGVIVGVVSLVVVDLAGWLNKKKWIYWMNVYKVKSSPYSSG